MWSSPSGPSLTLYAPPGKVRRAQPGLFRPCVGQVCSKRRASLAGPPPPPPLWLRYCIATKAGAKVNDVNDVPGLSEPHGPHGAMAVGGGQRAEISQSGTAGHLGPGV